MTLPVVAVVRPSNIEGLNSSQIGACQLEAVFFPGVGYSSLNPQAARGWRALSIATLAETGQTLTVTSTADAYRSYKTQVAAFNARYTPTYDPNVNTSAHQRIWNGVTYWLRKGRIPCAVPGKGFHPLGLAVDVAIFNPAINDGDPYEGDPTYIKGNAWLWAWLKLNVVSLGWSWEYEGEGVDDPHLHYWAGDTPTQRVLDLEAFFS